MDDDGGEEFESDGRGFSENDNDDINGVVLIGGCDEGVSRSDE